MIFEAPMPHPIVGPYHRRIAPILAALLDSGLKVSSSRLGGGCTSDRPTGREDL